ncbi:HU family DNA-binding protein [Devosia sp. CAU 1758]
MDQTVTRAALSESAADTTGLARYDTAQIGDRMFELIGDALKAGESVKLTGFGTLEVRSRAERVGRNPRTGDEHRIAPRRTVVLIPSARLREALASLAGKTGPR